MHYTSEPALCQSVGLMMSHSSELLVFYSEDSVQQESLTGIRRKKLEWKQAYNPREKTCFSLLHFDDLNALAACASLTHQHIVIGGVISSSLSRMWGVSPSVGCSCPAAQTSGSFVPFHPVHPSPPWARACSYLSLQAGWGVPVSNTLTSCCTMFMGEYR